MSELVITEGKLMSLRDSAQPMGWEELLDPKDRKAFDLFLSLVKELFGRDFSWLLFRDLEVPLLDILFTSEAIVDNYRKVAEAAVARFEVPFSRDERFAQAYRVAAYRFVQKRRASRIAVEVRIKAGTMQYGNYSYGIQVRHPVSGNVLSFVSSGAVSRPRWSHKRLATWHRWLPDGNHREEIEIPEFIPCMPGMGGNVALDVEPLPTEEGYWRWLVYLPDRSWQVKGGSTFWMPDNPRHSKAIIR
jgi:hypothetical protein